MIDLYYWPTPNGWKLTILFEELGIPYNVIPVDINKGEQFEADFLANRPQQPDAGGSGPRGRGMARRSRSSSRARSCCTTPRSTAASSPADERGRAEVLQWLLLPDGQRRADARPVPPLPQLRAGAAPLRGGALHQRGKPALPGGPTSGSRTATGWPVSIPSPTWRSFRGCGSGTTRGRRSRTILTSGPGWSATRRARRCARGLDVMADQIRKKPVFTEEERSIMFGARQFEAR